MNQVDPHPDSPVILTDAGAQAWKVKPLVEALVKVGMLAGSVPAHEPCPAQLGEMVGTIIKALREARLSDEAMQVENALYGRYSPAVAEGAGAKS